MVGNPDDIDSTLFLAKDQFSSLATPESISGLGDGGSVIAPSCVLGLPEEGGSFHANNDEYAGKVRLKENAVEARPLPMKRGNNRLGKKGMPRCEQCRNWKIKVRSPLIAICFEVLMISVNMRTWNRTAHPVSKSSFHAARRYLREHGEQKVRGVGHQQNSVCSHSRRPELLFCVGYHQVTKNS